MFKAKFEILNQDNKTDGALEIDDLSLKLRMNDGSIKYYSLREIQSIELLAESEFKGSQGVGGAILGGLLAGPLGAAAGASMGRLMRECIFFIEFSDGTIIPCRAMKKIHDNLKVHIKLKGYKI
jgi:hypothetical protein